MRRRASLVVWSALALTLPLMAVAAGGDGGRWIGREFTLRPTCQPRIGTRNIPLAHVPSPFRVQRVQGDWLWTGQAWVKKQDVVAVDDPIEVFDVAANGDFLILPVEIDGREYPFVVDTGASCTVVDRELKPKLQPVERSANADYRGPDPVEYRLPDVFVGRSKLPVRGTVICLDLKRLQKYSRREFQGILGMTFFQDKIISIDFDSGKLKILRSLPADCNDTPRLQFTGDRPMVAATVGKDWPESFLIDTGCMAEYGSIRSAVFEPLQQEDQIIDAWQSTVVATAYGSERRRNGILRRIQIGLSQQFNLHFTEARSSILGLGYLRRFRITFDFPNKHLYLKKGNCHDELQCREILEAEGVTDVTLSQLGRLTELKHLSLENTRLTDAGLIHLQRLTNLRQLSLDNTQVSDAGLEHLKGLANLRMLSLNNTRVSDAGLANLEGLTNLKLLTLDHSQVTDAGLIRLKALTNLTVLGLNQTRVTDAGLMHLNDLTRLERLYLNGTDVTDSGLKHLNQLANLLLLSLEHTKVTDAGLVHLQGLTNLERLYVGGTGVTDHGLPRLMPLTGLEDLWLNDTHVTDAGRDELNRTLPRLRIVR